VNVLVSSFVVQYVANVLDTSQHIDREGERGKTTACQILVVDLVVLCKLPSLNVNAVLKVKYVVTQFTSFYYFKKCVHSDHRLVSQIQRRKLRDDS
jgi:hypothetical protein